MFEKLSGTGSVEFGVFDTDYMLLCISFILSLVDHCFKFSYYLGRSGKFSLLGFLRILDKCSLIACFLFYLKAVWTDENRAGGGSNSRFCCIVSCLQE